MKPLHQVRAALWLPVLALALLAAGCGSPHAWYNKTYDRYQLEAGTPPLPAGEGTFVLWMIGDCGKSSPGAASPVFGELRRQLAEAGPNSAVVYLGDNIYEYGLPADGAPDRKEMERRMTAQLAPTAGYKGRVLVIPGNHDWAQGKPEGLAARLREEEFVEGHLDRGNTYLPDGGCPGPQEFLLDDRRVLLVLDTQWWLHAHEKPGKAQGCGADTDADFVEAMRAALARHAGKEVLVAAHHPLHSYGAHGGYYHPSYHLFPLRMVNHHLWVPLPVLGTAAVWYRKYHGSIQDIPHKRYQALKDALEELFAQYPGLIYLSGHDHNLQHLPVGGRHYIVSGSGSKSTYVGHGKRAQYTDATKGFARLLFTADGGHRLEFFAVEGETVSMRYVQEW